MPSGAKKRKAAKKKLQKEAHNNEPQFQGNDDAKSGSRDSDGGEFERENVDEAKSGRKFDGGNVEVNVGSSRGFQNGESSKSSSSSSSSSSDNDEVEIEKEKLVIVESGEVEQEGRGSVLETAVSGETVNPVDYVPAVGSCETTVISDVVDNSIGEGVRGEESVKELVSLPHDSNLVTRSVNVENSVSSDEVESGLKESINEVSSASVVQDLVSSAGTDLLQEKIESKVIQVVADGSGNSSNPADTTPRDNDGSLPQSSGVTTVDRNGINDHNKQSEEQPLVSSAPPPVRRTSWMNCCGLFDVISGGSSA